MKSPISPNLANLLVIDVGNSSTTYGLISTSSAKPSVLSSVPTKKLNRHSFASVIKHGAIGACISSVVPEVDKALARQLRRGGTKNILFVTPNTKSRVKNLYKKPSEVGADRLVNARAAMELTQGPSVVVDFGTATTFDCVARGGRYLGGVIAPGPVISAEALFMRTSKLPRVVLRKPAKILGRNTIEAIESGLYHGYRGLVTEIVRELKIKMGSGTKVIATGGQARWLLRGLPFIDFYDPYLTLRGLLFTWKDQQT